MYVDLVDGDMGHDFLLGLDLDLGLLGTRQQVLVVFFRLAWFLFCLLDETVVFVYFYSLHRVLNVLLGHFKLVSLCAQIGEVLGPCDGTLITLFADPRVIQGRQSLRVEPRRCVRVVGAQPGYSFFLWFLWLVFGDAQILGLELVLVFLLDLFDLPDFLLDLQRRHVFHEIRFLVGYFPGEDIAESLRVGVFVSVALFEF